MEGNNSLNSQKCELSIRLKMSTFNETFPLLKTTKIDFQPECENLLFWQKQSEVLNSVEWELQNLTFYLMCENLFFC